MPAATDPGVTAVHLCHQAYVALGCGFSEHLQVLISRKLPKGPSAPPPASQPSPLGATPVPFRRSAPLWGEAPHEGFFGSNAHVKAGSCASGQAALYLSFPTDRGKPAVPVRLILLIFPGSDFPLMSCSLLSLGCCGV